LVFFLGSVSIPEFTAFAESDFVEKMCLTLHPSFLNCTKIEATAIKELFMNHTFTMLLEEKKIDIDQTLSRADSPQQRQY
jgi:hypothetical protein